MNNMDQTCICTVVMPLYNRERYVKQAITSVMDQQTSYPIQLIIADDCSTDGSLEIAESMKCQFPEKISVLYSDVNRGLLANDIRVFENMKTEYFCVLDPDDYWIDFAFLQKAIAFLEEHKDFTCYSSNTVLQREGEEGYGVYIACKAERHVTNSIRDYLEGRAIVPHTTGSVYRNVIYKHGVPDCIRKAVGTISEASYRGDHDRFVLHLKYGKAMFVNELVGLYRIHKQGIWSGASQIHNDLISAQSKFDYSSFYDHVYDAEFRKLAAPDFLSALRGKMQLVQRGQVLDDEDERLLQEVQKEFGDYGDMVIYLELMSAITQTQTMVQSQAGVQKEVLWANIFHDTIRGSKWFSEQTALSPGRWALGYPGLYLLYRVLDVVQPQSILELGLGQSTKMIEDYVKYQKKLGGTCQHMIAEDDPDWVDFFLQSYSILDETEIHLMRRVEQEFDVETVGKTKVYMYENFKNIMGDKQYDLIFIDAPWGSEEYSRIDVTTILPDCLKDNFVIILDDCQRIGEQRSLQMIENILEEQGIPFRVGTYGGEKITECIVSESLGFLCSM